MKTSFVSVLILSFFALQKPLFGQIAPTLGTNASSFTLFTSIGALSNSGNSKVTGDIGTNSGDYSGFTSTNLIGSAHIQDGISASAASELSEAYDSFNLNACGTTLLSPLGQTTILAGVYCTTGETSLVGDLILDGNADPNSIFIIKVGGALSTASLSRILLINGALPANVYFQINGALTVGAAGTFVGTVIANGAIELLEAAVFTGKALTTAGAVTLHNNLVNSAGNPLPVTLTSFSAKIAEGQNILLTWKTTQELNSDSFEIQRSTDAKVWLAIGRIQAGGTLNTQSSYHYTDMESGTRTGSFFYRLKMIDQDMSFAYSSIREVKVSVDQSFFAYPNPAFDKVSFSLTSANRIERIQIINVFGQSVYDRSNNISEVIDISAFRSGMYITKFTDSQGNVKTAKIFKQ